MQDIVAAHPGTVPEKKPAGVVLHTRLAEDPVAAAAVEEAHRQLDGLDGAYVSEGKRVLEISVVRADKGEGLRQLQDVSGATAVVFAGDDVTDEHGFAVLGPSDVGVKVGPGPTPRAVPDRIAAGRPGAAGTDPRRAVRIPGRGHLNCPGWPRSYRRNPPNKNPNKTPNQAAALANAVEHFRTAICGILCL